MKIKFVNFYFKFYFKIFLLILFLAACNKQQAIDANDITALNEAINNNPSNDSLLHLRAKWFYSNQKIDSAKQDIEKALSINQNKNDYWLLIADIYWHKKDLSKTVEALETANRLAPKDTTALLKLAEIHLILTNYTKALNYAGNVVAIAPDNAKAYFLGAMCFQETGDTLTAIKQLKKAINVKPDYFDAIMNLGIIYYHQKDPLALEYFNNALNIKPNSTEALYAKAMYFQENNDAQKAKTLYQKIISIDSLYKTAYYNLGYITLTNDKNPQDAINYFSQAITIDSNYAQAYYNKALSLEILGKKLEAKQNYQKALSIMPDYQLAQKALKRLK